MNGMTSQNTKGQLNTTKTRVLRYVLHKDVKKYESMGWTVTGDLSHSHHGKYSVIMQAPNKK
jgi:hypothetical protein